MGKGNAQSDKILFVCNSCGNEFVKWSGKCPSCGEWNSLVESPVSTKVRSSKSKVQHRGKVQIVGLSSLSSSNFKRLTTNLSEFDRTLGGGFVPGQVVLLAGEPGIGKSTLLLQVADAIGRSQNQELRIKGSKDSSKVSLIHDSRFMILYIAGEESPLQIKQRAERLGLAGQNIEVVATTDLDEILGILSSKPETLNSKQTQDKNSQIPQDAYSLVIIDSIQTITSDNVASGAGSVAQVKECAFFISQACKERNLPVILIGHVNKEGDIAGPKVLEHIVDTVLYLEGERTLPFRLLRAIKNRFGDPAEVGVWQMGDRGFSEVKNPGAAFVAERGTGPGTAVAVVMEGNRPLLVEIQALAVKTAFGYPRRTASGVDLNRLFFLIAVVEKHLGVSLQGYDVYVNVAGGIKVTEPAADLAVVLSIVSSFRGVPLKRSTAAFGEVGLTGEVRAVPLSQRRLKEAEKLGFTNVLTVEGASTVRAAAAKAGL